LKSAKPPFHWSASVGGTFVLRSILPSNITLVHPHKYTFIMPICIECRFPVSTLYTTYSKADDKALGKGVRLTQCPRCKRFADKYVEHDFVVLFIDLVLIKPQVGDGNVEDSTAQQSTIPNKQYYQQQKILSHNG